MKFKDILLQTAASTGKGIAAVMAVVLLSFVLSVSQADAYSVYYNDFDDDIVDLSGWSTSDDSAGTIGIETIPNGWTSFLGQFGEYDIVTLTLTELPYGWMTLCFDAFFIRSWDGNDTDYGIDYFTVIANETTLLHETFSNANQAGQSYGGDEEGAVYDPMTGSDLQWALGYWFQDGLNPDLSDWMDSVYSFNFSFYNSTETLRLTFASSSWQDISDESWGLDNVNVATASVPEPCTLLLFASGAIGLFPLVRRRKRA